MGKRVVNGCLLDTIWLMNKSVTACRVVQELKEIRTVSTAAKMGEEIMRSLVKLWSNWKLMAAVGEGTLVR